jgi:hypothetical protein
MMAFQHHYPPQPGAQIYRTYTEPFEEITANEVAGQSGVARSTFNRRLDGKASNCLTARDSAMTTFTPCGFICSQSQPEL